MHCRFSAFQAQRERERVANEPSFSFPLPPPFSSSRRLASHAPPFCRSPVRSSYSHGSTASFKHHRVTPCHHAVYRFLPPASASCFTCSSLLKRPAMLSPPSFSTARLRFRAVEKSDAPFFQTLWSDEATALAGMGHPIAPFSMARAEAMVKPEGFLLKCVFFHSFFPYPPFTDRLFRCRTDLSRSFQRRLRMRRKSPSVGCACTSDFLVLITATPTLAWLCTLITK